jgi:hypothetical protein
MPGPVSVGDAALDVDDQRAALVAGERGHLTDDLLRVAHACPGLGEGEAESPGLCPRAGCQPAQPDRLSWISLRDAEERSVTVPGAAPYRGRIAPQLVADQSDLALTRSSFHHVPGGEDQVAGDEIAGTEIRGRPARGRVDLRHPRCFESHRARPLRSILHL